MVKGNANITIIQGDTYEKRIGFQNFDITTIESVFISSVDANINKQCRLDTSSGNVFIFELSSEETALLKEITTDYDLTVKFKDRVVSTVIYRGSLRILEKKNKVVL